MDEGWTRWVLEHWEFGPKTLHNADVKAGGLRRQFDVIVLADQQLREIVNGNESSATRPEYRGGIGDEGVQALKAFVAEGGTLVMLGNSAELAIQKWPIPVRNLKPGLTRDQHFAPGTIVRVQVDTASLLGTGCRRKPSASTTTARSTRLPPASRRSTCRSSPAIRAPTSSRRAG